VTRRDGDEASPAVPLRRTRVRATAANPTRTANRARVGEPRSRLSEARGYHPRGRTVGEAPRPRLRLVPDTPDAGDVSDVDSRPPGASRTITARATATKKATPAAEAPQSRTAAARSAAARSAATDPKRSATPRRVSRRVPPGPRLADQTRRLRLSTALILALFLVIAGRLILVQLTEAPALAQQGLSLRLETIDLPAPRGSIRDRNGDLLAGSAEARYVFVDPGLVKEPEATAEALVGVLGIPKATLLPLIEPHKRADGTVVRFEYLARAVPVATGDAVSALHLQGIGVVRDETRVVPGHDLAANIIGFTGDGLKGLGGLEASYDNVLSGVDGHSTYEVGQDGTVNLDHAIPGGYNQTTPARPGSSIELTIDRDLQFEVQRILGDKLRAVRADIGAAVVLDVRTGEVLAQASYPFYDAANPFAYQDSDRVDNASGWVVEPGSVHKGIVFASCLQQGVFTPTSVIHIGESVTKGDTTFTDTHYHVSNTITLPGILAYSSNIGTIAMADKLGAQNLYDFQRAFGLGSLTGENLPGESAGLVQPPANWSASSYGSIPIGHGVSVTALQMAAVYATVANGGTYVQPHLLRSVIAPDGTVTPTPGAPSHSVLSPQVAAELRTMLEAVVDVPDATGHSAAVANYRIAGKTGTGRLIVNGKPVAGDVASFVGMAPADAPRYVIAVFAHLPGQSGGVVAGQAFSEMMAYTLLHYRVAPSGTKPPTFKLWA
jgi:cell division protein FtsI (penicillin-binding protein 3)